MDGLVGGRNAEIKKRKLKKVSALFLKGSVSTNSVMHGQVCFVDMGKGEEYSMFFSFSSFFVVKGRARQSRTCRSSWRKRCHGKL